GRGFGQVGQHDHEDASRVFAQPVAAHGRVVGALELDPKLAVGQFVVFHHNVVVHPNIDRGVIAAAARVLGDHAVVRAAREDAVFAVVEVPSTGNFEPVDAEQEYAYVDGILDCETRDLEVAHFECRASGAWFEVQLLPHGDAVGVPFSVDDRGRAA